MEHPGAECHDPHHGAEIEAICEAGNPEEFTVYASEPGYLRDLQSHWSACGFCQMEFPNAAGKLDLIREGVTKRAVTAIQKLSAEYDAEFGQITSSTDGDGHYADRLAALASTHSAPLNWHLSFLPATPARTQFSLFKNPAESGNKCGLAGCAHHLDGLAPHVLRFVFATVLAGELYSKLFDRFWRMQFPFLMGKELDGGGMEITENPDYAAYQAYELKASSSPGFYGSNDEDDPLYGGPILLKFIFENLRETLQQTDLDYRVMHSLVEQTAEAYRLQYGAEPGATSHEALSHSSATISDLRSDLADGIDSLRAGQMELRLAIERQRRSAEEFLPAIQSRLGVVYAQLHHETRRLLALGEYFRSMNQAEPDAMNVVVLHQAKACEHELYMRIFGPYIMQLLSDGVADYLQNGFCTKPLLLRGKEVLRNMILGTYCWYLKNDSRLTVWIESKTKAQVPMLVNEAYWISEQRNRAAHESGFSALELTVFQERLFSPNGFLNRLHAQG